MMEQMLHQCPVTCGYACGIIAVLVISGLGILPPQVLVYDYYSVFHKLELWRLVTALFYYGRPNLMLIISLYIDIRYIYLLETSIFSQRRSTLLFILLLCIIPVYIISGLMGSYFISYSFNSAIDIIASKLVSSQVLLFGVIPMPMRFLPLFNLFLAVAQNQSVLPLIVGYLAGHMIFYFLYVFPVITKAPVFRTPNCLRQLLD